MSAPHEANLLHFCQFLFSVSGIILGLARHAPISRSFLQFQFSISGVILRLVIPVPISRSLLAAPHVIIVVILVACAEERAGCRGTRGRCGEAGLALARRRLGYFDESPIIHTERRFGPGSELELLVRLVRPEPTPCHPPESSCICSNPLGLLWVCCGATLPGIRQALGCRRCGGWQLCHVLVRLLPSSTFCLSKNSPSTKRRLIVFWFINAPIPGRKRRANFWPLIASLHARPQAPEGRGYFWE